MRVSPTPTAQAAAAVVAMTRTDREVLHRGKAMTRSTATAPDVVAWPDGKENPLAVVAQSAVGGRGRAMTWATPRRSSWTAARARSGERPPPPPPPPPAARPPRHGRQRVGGKAGARGGQPPCCG